MGNAWRAEGAKFKAVAAAQSALGAASKTIDAAEEVIGKALANAWRVDLGAAEEKVAAAGWRGEGSSGPDAKYDKEEKQGDDDNGRRTARGAANAAGEAANAARHAVSVAKKAVAEISHKVAVAAAVGMSADPLNSLELGKQSAEKMD